MSSDLEQQQPAAPLPPPANFAYGASAGRSGGNNRLVAVVAAVAVLGAGAFVGLKVLGGGEPEPTPPVVAKKAPTKPALTTDSRTVLVVLRNVATAEESYRTEETAYSTTMADLVDQGFAPDGRVKVRLISADAKRFCVSAAGAGKLVYYYDSRTGVPSKTACH